MAPETFITYHRDEEALTIIGHLMDGHNKHGHTLNDISFKLQELEETVTGSTTSLSGGSGIEITNDNIINLDFSEFSTDNITEGSTNLFHSDEKVDDRVNNLLQEGSNIVHTYDDVANTFTISTSMDPTFDSVDSAIVFTAVTDVNITRGQVVYISGTAGNGTTPTVDLAIASNAAKMPAFGMARDNASANQTIKIVTFGSLHGITLPNTITFALGDTLYVSSVSAGAYTNVPPGGESNLIQNIGKVQRIGSGSSSVIKVGGAGRTNATSNLNSGNIFYGNSSDQAVTATLTEGNNVTITHDSVNETLTISALGTAVSGNENEVHVINSTGDGFKVSNPLLYMDSGINALIVGYDSANPTEGGSDLNCRQVIAGQTVKSVELYAGSGGAQAGYRSKIGNDIHLGAGIYESTWNGNGSISAFYYDVYNGSRQTNPEIKIARLSNVTKGQIGHHTFQIGPHSTDGSVKFIVDLYNNASNTQGEMARVAIGREPIADTPFTVGSLHVLELSTTAHQVIIGGSTTANRYFTFSETGKLGLGNTQDYGSSGQVLTSGGSGVPTWESVNSLLLDESQHVSGSITHSDTVVDIYNKWESDTQYKGAILTLSDNSYDPGAQVYTKTVRAAIKGGTSSTGTDTSGYLAVHTSDGTGNEAREVARFTSEGKFGLGEDTPDTILHITSSANGGPQVKMGNGTDYSFINFDGTSLQLSTQRDMVNGNWSNTAKSWGGINIQGPSTGSSINFYTSPTNNTAPSQRMILDENGVLGINTTPGNVSDAKLVVDSGDGKRPAIKARGSNSNGHTMLADLYTETESQFHMGVGYSGAQGVISHSCKVSHDTNNKYLSSHAQYATRPMALCFDAGDFVFKNTNTSANTTVDDEVVLTEKLRIDSRGFVGIGTTGTISNHLHVKSGATNIAAQFESTDGVGGIMLKDSTGNVELTTSGTNGFNVQPAGGASVFTINGDGTARVLSGNQFRIERNSANYTAIYTELIDTTSNITRIKNFYNNGNYHNLTIERYNRININALTSTGGTNRGVFLSGNVISHNGTVVSSSDDRLKDDESSISDVYNKINLLNVKQYTKYTFDTETGARTGDGIYEYGLIAQDLLNTDLSFCVTKNNYGTEENPDNFYYSIGYQNLFCINLEATKQLIEEMNTLRTEVENLKQQVSALQS